MGTFENSTHAVAAVLISLLLCLAANAQVDATLRNKIIPACYKTTVIKGASESDVTGCLGLPQRKTTRFTEWDFYPENDIPKSEFEQILGTFIGVEFDKGKVKKVRMGSLEPPTPAAPPPPALPIRNPSESDEHWFARQEYELADQAYGNAVHREAAMVNEVVRLQSKWYGGITLDQQQEILKEAHDLRNQLDIAANHIDVLKARVEHADNCVTTYHQTIDKKTSDLTTRETQQIAACQSINLYPPAK
jgi:hypothetical protein